MPIRILHTADNHIGLSFGSYPDGVRERLVNERFDALQRMVHEANQRQAHFFVVSGDLFDKVTVPVADITRTVDILKGFEGEAVLVLAGNHDFCEDADSTLWKRFRKAADGTNIIPLTEPGTRSFTLDEGNVRFYACPCPSKHGEEHMIGWVAAEPKDEGILHIGLAHGNVERLGLDADHRYFNMGEADLRAAGVHTWLLGHIHVPAPDPGTSGLPLYFMPGIHTPDSVKVTHPGHAWWIELDAGGASRMEQLTTGAIAFTRITRELKDADDITALDRQCNALDGPNTVLDIQLSGRLKTGEFDQLRDLLKDLGKRFLHLSHDLDIAEVLAPEAIAKLYPEGTLPHAWLSELLQDAAHPGDAQLALDLIQTLEQA
ncbi:MAG TPA: metallophosphoesterase [Flavobacteriales bacterium]|nr:metallophosphoesterase [Flavobacteriales bacterium]